MSYTAYNVLNVESSMWEKQKDLSGSDLVNTLEISEIIEISSRWLGILTPSITVSKM
jgi:predicted PolB exonuclease-like 3'-5' exonuclease